MNNNGNFNNGAPAALMSFPYSMHNQPQHPPLMEQPYMNQQPPPPSHFQSHTPRFFNPRPTMQTPKSEKRKQEILTCDACGIEVNSQQMMDAHIRGQKHIKKMKLKTVSTVTPSINQTSTTTDVEQKPVCSTVSTTTELAPVIEPNPPSTPVVDVVKPSSSNEKSVLQLMNELAKFNKVTTKYDLIKESGPAHCKQFEVRLTVADETYTGIGTSIKRAQQVAAEQALTMTALKKPESSQRSPHSVRTPRRGTGQGMYSSVRHQYSTQQTRQKSHSLTGQQQQYHQQTVSNNENLLQNLINNKCAEITENENTIRILHCLVEDIERALKTVSDKIMEQCKLNNISVVPQLPDNVKLNNTEQLNEDPSESFRMLKGAMKVSTLAMRLFLQNDYEYSLVLICANKPTVTLLNDICQELSIGLNAQAIAAIQLDSTEEQSKPITYQVQAHVNDACLTVQCSLLPKHTIRIMLTSPVFRTENFLNLDDSTRQQIVELNPDPTDMLDKNKCLEAAAEIRHSNWFTRCMLEHNSNLIVLRLLRDLQYNQTPLSSLNLWCLALLVHKCQNQPSTSSTHLFRAVFACLSSGILLPNHIGPGIIDPCEKELVDAAAYLTLEQRLNITSYAQNILRLICFEKYETIFHMKSNQTEQLSMNSTLGDNKME
ncbi:unnamed protein product [Rotaria sp. Silwood1]|nr:unnamed protein product [Rotaria sp. Silwood1]CAF1002221.1 unnamed protein product [Rotaria sp. Silwood1]CAF3396636.1 unnamed protein product [Rotaria sp. Silwood1]CAF4635819.1 unnamed protein product [Rotaria sp. Silwood1]